MNTKPKILVTGATGNTGSAVVHELLRLGQPVRAIVHSRDARSKRLDQLGVETVVADMYDPGALLAAMRGTQRAYYLPLFRPFMIQAAAAFVVAAQDARLEFIVQMSQWTSNPAHPAIMTRQTWLVDRIFATIPGVAHTIVNPGMFAHNFLRFIDFAALLGFFPVLTGTSKCAPVANEDIARVVAAVLIDPAPHLGKSYRPTGPKLLSGQEMAAHLQRVLGRRVRAMNIPTWMFLKVARMQRVDPFQIHSVLDYMKDHKRGVFEFEGGVNDIVRELTGRPAEDFETTARRYAAKPFAQRTIFNRARALANFMITPLYPGYDLRRYEREHEFPWHTRPQLSADSEFWRAEHTTAPRVETSPVHRRGDGRPGQNAALHRGCHMLATPTRRGVPPSASGAVWVSLNS